MRGRLFPMVAMKSPTARLSANFGHDPVGRPFLYSEEADMLKAGESLMRIDIDVVRKSP